MKQKELFSLLDGIQEDQDAPTQNRHDRVLILDGLNLFFRNFAMMNMVNPDGVHIGGLGGFFRSLGAMIRQTNPTSVYVVFDGAGSTVNRKNLLSEYKGTRNLSRITNWEAFDNIEEEHDSKIDQIVRIIQYLKLLPVKTTILDKVEADDIIAVLAEKLVEKHDSTCFIVSSDKDFLQLVTDKIIVYRPMEKEYYTPKVVEEKFGLLPHNFILHKTLLGDNSDNLKGVKGLGIKTIVAEFPKLLTEISDLDYVFKVAEEKLESKKVFAKIITSWKDVEDNFAMMDLHDTALDESEISKVMDVMKTQVARTQIGAFLAFLDDDSIEGITKNTVGWLDNFRGLIVK